MKFAKRFAASFADPDFSINCLDYRALKKVSKKLAGGGGEALAEFDALLRSELQKVDAFYSDREAELEATMAALSGKTCFCPAASKRNSANSVNNCGGTLASSLGDVRAQAKALQRFASLNYVAVLKAVKKRDRRLSEGGGGGEVPSSPSSSSGIAVVDAGAAPRPAALRALSRTRFFSSTRLAALATAAEVAMAEEAMRDLKTTESGSVGGGCENNGGGGRDEFSCAVCLGLLAQPVVLSCGHRFCWGCAAATAGAAVAARHKRQHREAEEAAEAGAGAGEGGRSKKLKGEEGGEGEAPSTSTTSPPRPRRPLPPSLKKPPLSPASPVYWGCPVCRKPHALTATSAISSTATSAAADVVGGGFSLGLDVDENLERLVLKLAAAKSSSSGSSHSASSSSSLALPSPPPPTTTAATDEFLLPPLDEQRHPRSSHPLTVVLDLDGTLIASYPPSRAGALLSPRDDGGGGSSGSSSNNGNKKRKPPAAFIVGQGSELNPQGVLVLERPGLGDFLLRLSEFAEVVVFTAGLEGYAAPIVRALEGRHGPLAVPAPSHRLFRCSTSRSEVYPCVKDLSRLGRCPKRTVLIEDTALAGLAQPENVVPVMPWRAEAPDDRILCEAVLPLLESLAASASPASSSSSSPDEEFDVRCHLRERFGLRAWFASQGVPCGDEAMERKREEVEEEEMEEEEAAAASSSAASSFSRLPSISEEEEEEETPLPSPPPPSPPPPLFLCDFDHTLVDFDSAEDVVSQLAPELAPMLRSLRMPADFIPLTNAVAAEAERRGVSEGQWLEALREAGRRGLLGRGGADGGGGGGGASVLRAAAAGGADVRILSDANDLFISTMLSAAGVSFRIGDEGEEGGEREEENGASFSSSSSSAVVVSGVVTNRASFVSLGVGDDDGNDGSRMRRTRLVVEPRHDTRSSGPGRRRKLRPHGCPLCPSNLCKGLELGQLAAAGSSSESTSALTPTTATRKKRTQRGRRTVIYAGDGENDLCPALSLSSPGDSLLVRRGRGLERLLRERAAEKKEKTATTTTSAAAISPTTATKLQNPSLARAFDASLSSALAETSGASVFVWDTAEELRVLVEALLLCCDGN